MDDENLSILLSMGFPDIAECKRALQMAKGKKCCFFFNFKKIYHISEMN